MRRNITRRVGDRQHGYAGLGAIFSRGGGLNTSAFTSSPAPTQTTQAAPTTSLRIATSTPLTAADARMASMMPLSSQTLAVAPRITTTLQSLAPAPAPAPTSQPSVRIASSTPTTAAAARMASMLPYSSQPSPLAPALFSPASAPSYPTSQPSVRIAAGTPTTAAGARMESMLPYSQQSSPLVPALFASSPAAAAPMASQQQAMPGAFQAAQWGPQGFPGYAPQPIPGEPCPPGTIPGKNPGQCFSSGEGGMRMPLSPYDPYWAGVQTMNTPSVPKVSVNVSTPARAAAEQAEKDLEQISIPASAPTSSTGPAMVAAAAGLLALLFLK